MMNFKTQLEHCECACHYFPTVIKHKESCCNATELFVKLVELKKAEKKKLNNDMEQLGNGSPPFWKNGSPNKNQAMSVRPAPTPTNLKWRDA